MADGDLLGLGISDRDTLGFKLLVGVSLSDELGTTVRLGALIENCEGRLLSDGLEGGDERVSTLVLGASLGKTLGIALILP